MSLSVLTEHLAKSMLGTPALDQGFRRQILESRKLHLFISKAVKLLTLVLGLECERWPGSAGLSGGIFSKLPLLDKQSGLASTASCTRWLSNPGKEEAETKTLL